MKQALKTIMAFFLGRKYYANIITTTGTDKLEICSYIFTTREEAKLHEKQVEKLLSFDFVETISFRSRKVNILPPRESKKLNRGQTVFRLHLHED